MTKEIVQQLFKHHWKQGLTSINILAPIREPRCGSLVLLEKDGVAVNALESNHDDYRSESKQWKFQVGDRKGRAPLFRAIENQNEDIVREFLKHEDININQEQEPYGNYPISDLLVGWWWELER